MRKYQLLSYLAGSILATSLLTNSVYSEPSTQPSSERKPVKSEYFPAIDSDSLNALKKIIHGKEIEKTISAEESIRAIRRNLVRILVNKNPNSISAYAGTGLQLTSNGYILTASHIIDPAEKNISHTRANNTPLEFYVDLANQDTAILKTRQNPEKIGAYRIKMDWAGKSIKVGAEVRLISLIGEEPIMSLGVIINDSTPWIMARENGDIEEIPDSFFTDIRVKKGNSGGVFVNEEGEIIGIVTYTSKPLGNDKLGYAGGVRLNAAKRCLESLLNSAKKD